MKFIKIIGILLVYFTGLLSAQTRTELEEQRKKTLEDISYVDNLLKSTAKVKSESLSAVKILGNKVNLRESVIKGMGQEISLINERIELNRIAIEMMENDLVLLKTEYSRAIVNMYKAKKINPEIVYILSARDFNQGYKRLKYLQQVSEFRRNESEIIAALKTQIEETKGNLEKDLLKMSDLRHKEVIQKNMLQDEQIKKQKMVRSLSNKEKQLQKDLAEKKKIAKRIEDEIARIIEAERKKSVKTALTPEQKIIGDNFSDNKGRLPWPVERGIITSHFGTHQHPVLKYLTEENIGVEITSSGKTLARSVFKGEVTAISVISGSNMTVIIQHGKYYSVYNNLVNVKVKKGDKVEIKQIIG
ncbi:MAG: Peptidase protein, partial [Bacteroidota bacterium]|nr:Peptidase protein [Bacteroidota bacterium]